MKKLLPKIFLSLAGVAVTAAVTAGTATAKTSSAIAAHTPTWNPVLTLRNASSSQDYWSFASVVATGKTTGWAFMSDSKQKTYSYQRTGSTTWKRVAFPGTGCRVNVAGAAKDGRVFASCAGVTGPSKEYEWTGAKWTLIRILPGTVSSMSVLSADDVWFFGDHGVIHWNGRTWKQLTKSTRGGSALADNSVWVFSGDVISHYDGKKWTAVHAPGPTGVTGILALSATSVYATGDDAGAAALLHYNGHAWSRVWESGDLISFLEQQILPDGKGGLWIPANDQVENPALLHYSAGKMTVATLPDAAFEFPGNSDMARIPDTAEMLLAGEALGTNNKLSPVIYQYS
jgi:hypothetical protein